MLDFIDDFLGCPDVFEDEDRNELLDVEFEEVVRETPKAWFILFDNGDFLNPIRHWIPKSVATIDLDESIAKIPRWLVEEKGIEGYVSE